MSSHFAKPENALRKAKDLLRVNKESTALKTLQTILTSKRYKTWSTTHEKIMFFYIELAVDLHRPVSDALFQYRSICSTQNTASLEKVLKKYRQLSEQKAREAQHLADTSISVDGVAPTKLEKRKMELEEDVNTELEEDPEQDEDLLPAASVDDVEDLEEESPESLMLQAVSGQGSRDRKDRQILAPWVKYLWETYRTILEVLRNNGKLEILYHKTARQAFLFCRRFKRSVEFRRLGEILRNHLGAIQKYTHQTNNVDLNSPETQKLYLETRFQQLKIASEMELWQEAYRTIEDIHENMRLSRTEPKPEIMKTYYDKLSQIFWASENYLFHAYSLNRYYQLSVIDGLDGEEKQKLATSVLLATLCIPPRDRFGDDTTHYSESEHEGNLRLANLLGFKKETPTRARLIAGLISSGLFDHVSDDVRTLYELSEIKFGPLSLYTQVAPILKRLQEQHNIYVEPIQNLVVLRVIQQLATVFKSIRIDKFLSLVPSLPLHHIERLVMSAVQSDQVQLRMDHRTQLLHFSEEGMEGPRLRDQLSILARSLQRVADIIEPMNASEKLIERQHVFHAIQQGVDSEHDQVFVRQQEIEKRKQESEREAQERERREVEQKAKAAHERKVEEQKRLAEESARREAERQKRQQEERDAAAKKRLAQEVIKIISNAPNVTGKAVEALKEFDDVTNISKQEILRRQQEILQQQQYETEKRHKEVAKRIDYMTRAMRMEEKELLIKQMELQQITDREQHEADFKKYLETHRVAHDKAIEDKKRLSRMAEQRAIFHEKLMARRQEEYAAAKKKQDDRNAKLNQERARMEKIRDEAEAALQRYRDEKEEEEKKRQEEEERAVKQAEEERALKEKIARDRRAKLEESAAKQRAREAELDAKEAARRGGGSAAPPAARTEERPARAEDGWRPSRETGGERERPAAATQKPAEKELDWSKARRADDEPAANAPPTAAASESRPWTRRTPGAAAGAGADATAPRPPGGDRGDRPSDDSKKWRSDRASDRPERSERDWGRGGDRDRPSERSERDWGRGGDRDRERERDRPSGERPWTRRGEEGEGEPRQRDEPAPREDDGGRQPWRPSRGGAGGDRDRERDRAAGGADRWTRDRPRDEDRAGDRWSRDRSEGQERRSAGGDDRFPPRRGGDDVERERPRRDDTQAPSRDRPARDEQPPAEDDGFTQVGRSRPAGRR